jgi:hypothetical protein
MIPPSSYNYRHKPLCFYFFPSLLFSFCSSFTSFHFFSSFVCMHWALRWPLGI